MNKFLKTPLDVNYQTLREYTKLRDAEIVTIDDYVSWVREWKIFHNELVEAIKFARKEKWIGKGSGDRHLVGQAHYVKMTFRPYAHELYELRTENKAALHAGQYKEVELA
jgi:hypothetical protein